MVNTISVNAVAFQDGSTWVVQGIEYDLTVLARTVQDIPKAFANAVIERLYVAEHLGVDPFQGVEPAPARFHNMFEEAMTEMKLKDMAGSTVRLVETAQAA